MGRVTLDLWAEGKTKIAYHSFLRDDLVERPGTPVILLQILYGQINKSAPSGAKINRAAAESGVNHAELFNPGKRVELRGLTPCDFFPRYGTKGSVWLKLDVAIRAF